MDSADGLTPEQCAAACGIGGAVESEPGANEVFTDDDRVMLAAMHELLSNSIPKRTTVAASKPTKTARPQASRQRRPAHSVTQGRLLKGAGSRADGGKTH